jgi:23S rRNA U2552 (ribose-2'-O)-methylase RlmE/FtsJ
MSYYLLPKTPFLIHKYIDYVETDALPTPVISTSLSEYLYEIKEKIEEREKDWDIYKKYTNPYEYVHSVIPFKKKSVAKLKPLSRSYFKMIELVNTFQLAKEPSAISTFHLAEGPGGFIEAIASIRKNPDDIYIGMTLIDDKNDPNIPGWKKSDMFLKMNKNVYIEKGVDNTGNILSLPNLIGCKESYGSSIDIITADGGFDFSIDFNKQEYTIAQLLFAQVCYAVTMQKKGGTFILKIFDCFMQHTMDVLCILSSFYDKVYITKPNTSRYANSEKYIVCKNFLLPTCEKFFPFIQRAFQKMNAPRTIDKPLYTHRFLTLPLPLCFVTKLEEYNAILGQQQIENIHYTITLIDNKQNQDKIDSLIKMNVQKCMQLCAKYDIAHNIIVINNNNNVFLQI